MIGLAVHRREWQRREASLASFASGSMVDVEDGGTGSCDILWRHEVGSRVAHLIVSPCPMARHVTRLDGSEK